MRRHLPTMIFLVFHQAGTGKRGGWVNGWFLYTNK